MMLRKIGGVSLVMFAVWLGLGNTDLLAQGRLIRSSRTAVRTPSYTSVPTSDLKVFSNETTFTVVEQPWAERFAAACDNASKTAVAPTAARLQQTNHELGGIVRTLEAAIRREFRENGEAEAWQTRLRLSDLTAASRGQDVIDAELLATVAGELEGEYAGTRFKLFDPLRDAVRQYRTAAATLDGNFSEQIEGLFANLPTYVEKYQTERDPAIGFALAGALRWISDMDRYIPNGRTVRTLLEREFAKTNILITASESLLSLPFQRAVAQCFDVNDTILDARVRGTGTLIGGTSAELVQRRDVAEIHLLLDAQFNSQTRSVRPPVVVNTVTQGTVRSEKPITISASGITVSPSVVNADLQSTISNINVDGGHIVSKIAKRAVANRKGEAQAQAARKAEQRIARQVDDEADPQLRDINARFQKILQPLLKTNLFPREWTFSTDSATLLSRLTVMAPWQVATPPTTPQPDAPAGADVVLRIHQSAANNGATLGLAGRSVEEEKLIAEMQERFANVPAALQRPESEPAWRFSFAREQPIAVSFDSGVVRCVLRIDQFRRDGVDRVPPADLDIIIAYRVTESDGKIVWEQTEPVGVVPRGFNQNDQVPARLLASCMPVRERLNAQIEKRIEAAPIELPEQFGNKKLVPFAAKAENGWLTLAWKLAE